jgi:hypothetical protein
MTGCPLVTASPVADLPERLDREGGDPLVAGRVEECERQCIALHGIADIVERDPGILERSGEQTRRTSPSEK